MTELATTHFPETPPDPDIPCRRCPVLLEHDLRFEEQSRQYDGTILIGASLMQKFEDEDSETFAGIEELSDGELDTEKIVTDMRRLVVAMMEGAERKKRETEEFLDNTRRSCVQGARVREAVRDLPPQEGWPYARQRTVFSQCRSGGELSPTHVQIMNAEVDMLKYQ